jgi:hypothetical protein
MGPELGASVAIRVVAQITVPAGMTPFFMTTTMPSRIA